MKFRPLLHLSRPNGPDLNLKPLTPAMAMMVARALLLLAPIVFASAPGGKGLAELFQSNLGFLLYYLLAMFDLLCFVELYFVKKQLEADAENPLPWAFGAELLLVQALTLNAMSLACLAYFLFQNSGKLELRRRFKQLSPRARGWAALNALILGMTLSLFFFLFFLYRSRL